MNFDLRATQQTNRQRFDFLGCHLDACSLDEAVATATNAIRTRSRLQYGDVNVNKFISFRRDSELHRFTEESDLVCADGMGIVWGCKLLGVPITERVTGIDFMERLIEVCAREGFRPYFLGANPQTVDAAVTQLRRAYPKLEIAGWRNGYFSREEEMAVVADIRSSGADCLFVGISSPIKERFLNNYRDLLAVPVQVGVGGSFDVLAGDVRRAPHWMQIYGLEWFFRLMQEPSRLWRRYLVTNSQYACILAVAAASHAGRHLLAGIGHRSKSCPKRKPDR